MKKIAVVAAVIKHEDKILCVQRAPSKYDYISLKYEFPGGKVEQDETPSKQLFDEIQEELNMEIVVHSHLITVDYKITLTSVFL